MTIPYGKIKPVPTHRIEEKSWQLAFQMAQAKPLPSPCMDVKRYSLFSTQDDILRLALHRVYRQHWDSKHKFPCRLTKAERQAIEIYGDYWWEQLKLCERLHSHQNFGEPYANAAHWFTFLFLEFKEIKVNSDSDVSKTDLTDFMSQSLKKLRNYENPFDPDFEPHLARLIDAAISLANPFNQFRRQHWYPFLRSFAAWRDDLRENTSWYAVLKDESGRYYNQGRGRCRRRTFRDT